MSIGNKIKALLNVCAKEHKELAEYLEISPQALSNKFYRDSFNTSDLVKIAEFTNSEIGFFKGDFKITLDNSDIKKEASK